MVGEGTVNATDLELIHLTDSVEEAVALVRAAAAAQMNQEGNRS
jgi:hypothetical protein